MSVKTRSMSNTGSMPNTGSISLENSGPWGKINIGDKILAVTGVLLVTEYEVNEVIRQYPHLELGRNDSCCDKGFINILENEHFASSCLFINSKKICDVDHAKNLGKIYALAPEGAYWRYGGGRAYFDDGNFWYLCPVADLSSKKPFGLCCPHNSKKIVHSKNKVNRFVCYDCYKCWVENNL